MEPTYHLTGYDRETKEEVLCWDIPAQRAAAARKVVHADTSPGALPLTTEQAKALASFLQMRFPLKMELRRVSFFLEAIAPHRRVARRVPA